MGFYYFYSFHIVFFHFLSLTSVLWFVTLYMIKRYIDIMAEEKISLQNLPDLLTIKEAAAVLRVSPLTLKRWGKRGKLPAIRINSRGDRRYKKEAILYLLGMP